MTYRVNGPNLRALRELRGWSQTALAREVGISVSHISRVESGERDMSAVTVHRVAEALSIPVGAILTIKTEEGVSA